MSKSKHFKGGRIPTPTIPPPDLTPQNPFPSLSLPDMLLGSIDMVDEERWLITHESKSVQRPPHTEIWNGTVQEFLEQFNMCYITYAVRL
jgi:hypothetical protein